MDTQIGALKRIKRGSVLLILVGLLVTGCGATAPSSNAPTGTNSPSGVPAQRTQASAADQTQTNEGGGVTVKATWQGAEAPIFAIVLDTHLVDLDGYDLHELAVLRIDGNQEVRPTGWGAPKGGHHRQGTLTFPATTETGAPVIGPDTRTIELVIREVGGVPERVLQWTR